MGLFEPSPKVPSTISDRQMRDLNRRESAANARQLRRLLAADPGDPDPGGFGRKLGVRAQVRRHADDN